LPRARIRAVFPRHPSRSFRCVRTPPAFDRFALGCGHIVETLALGVGATRLFLFADRDEIEMQDRRRGRAGEPPFRPSFRSRDVTAVNA
jgi:hypothetical protein